MLRSVKGYDGSPSTSSPAHFSSKMGRRGSLSTSSSLSSDGSGLVSMLFGLDYRSLAMYRVCVSILLLLDLWVRSRYLHEHYSGLATWPSHLAADEAASFSLHFISGEMPFLYALWIMNAIFVFFMLIGYRTRLFTFLSWMMLASLHTRNGYVLNGGDDFLRCMLFWAMWLPLGARYSVDSTLLGNTPPAQLTSQTSSKYYLSVATVAAMGQFALIYYFTAVLKTGPEWTLDYTAVYYAVYLDQFATRWAILMRGFPALMKLLTVVTIYFEYYGTLLFILPFPSVHGPLRTLGVLGFVAMHAGFGTCLELGFFMYIPSVCATMFLPAWFWDTLVPSILRRPKSVFTVHYNPKVTGLDQALSILRTFFLNNTSLIPMATQEEENQAAHDQTSSSLSSSSSSSSSSFISNRDPSITISLPRDVHVAQDDSEWIEVIEEHTGQRYLGFDGIVQLFRSSRVLFVLVPVMCADFLRHGLTLLAPFFLSSAHKVFPSAPMVGPTKRSRAKEGGVLFFFLVVLTWNFASYYQFPIPDTVRFVGLTTRLDQWWGMFAPAPAKVDGWMYYPGILADGTYVNVFEGRGVSGGRGDAKVHIKEDGTPEYSKPDLVSHQFATQRWRKYLMNIQIGSLHYLRLPYGQYLCREWNFYDKFPPNKHLKSYKIVYVTQITPEPDQPWEEPEHVTLWEHVCF